MSSLITRAIVEISSGDASAWTSADTTLNQGEWGLETDTMNVKIGDGSTAWTSLPYKGWNKIADPPTGNLATKTDAWTTDDFGNGLEVDFSDAVSSTGVPVGAKAVRVSISQLTASGVVYYRKSGDSNISNTPNASSEFSHRLLTGIGLAQMVLWLSSDYKVQFTSSDVGTDLYINYPIEYLF